MIKYCTFCGCEFDMVLQSNKILPKNYPLGAALLYLRGARKNLDESLNSKDRELIWIRRKELSVILNGIEESHKEESAKQSLVTYHLINNLEIEIRLSIAMLDNASSYLSAALSLA